MNQNNVLLQLIKYLFVGLLATVVEWVGFYVFGEVMHINYLLATAFAFFFSTFANWLFGRLIMFKKNGSLLAELIKIYLTSIIGLVLNLVLMYVMVDMLGMMEMLAKMTATGIVFIWNFLIRKLVIYK